MCAVSPGNISKIANLSQEARDRSISSFQCSFAIPRFDDLAFQHLPLVDDGASEVACHALNPHKHRLEAQAQCLHTPVRSARFRLSSAANISLSQFHH
jgi:hypothetical protein